MNVRQMHGPGKILCNLNTEVNTQTCSTKCHLMENSSRNGIFYSSKFYSHYSPVTHYVLWVKGASQKTTGPPDQPVQFLSVPSRDAAIPADHTIKDG